MIPIRSSLWCVLAVAAVGCHGDAVTNSPVVPKAGIHFVNAVPDTAKMDFRVVDIISNAGLFGQAFRGANMFTQGIESGARQIRVFYDTNDVQIAQTKFSDTTHTYVADQNYTFVEAGFARGGAPARAVWILASDAPDPGAGNVGIRVIHAGAGIGNVDVYLLRRDTTATLNAPTATNVAYAGVGTYGAVAASDTTAGDSLRIVVTATGTTAPVLINVLFPIGAAATDTTNPVAGSAIPRSSLTAVIVPASVAGSQAPQGGAFAAPSALFLVDRRPANTIP